MTGFLHELKRRNVLRVALLYLVSAWLIAQVADVVSGLAGLPPSVGRAVLIVLALGFPVALVLAWVFEWTPAGIRREGDAGEPRAAAPAMRHRIDYVIIALLSVAVVYLVATHDWRGRPPVSASSIAVLPFDNYSARDEDIYFADGIHDDLLTQLAKISSLVVISRTSVMQYRNTAKPIREIAGELGVATILLGSVQRSGNRVRVNLQLIDASDKHLWAETYDRELTADNLFAIQSEIATSIAGILKAELRPAEEKRLAVVPTHSLDAYDAYLLGRRALAIRRDEAFADAQEYFERAIEADPGFALAWAGLADALSLRAGFGEADLGAALAEAEHAARKALELDPELGEAYSSIGLVMRTRGDDAAAYVPYLRRAIELSPGSADARKWYANYLGETGRDEEAREHLELAARQDPMSPIVRVNLGETLAALGRPDEALASFRKALEIDPGFMQALFSIAAVSDIDESLVAYSGAYAAGTDPWTVVFVVLSYLELDDVARAEQWQRYLERVAPDSIPAWIAGLNVNAYLGREAKATAFARRMVELEAPSLPMPSRLLSLYDLRRGDAAAARARYAERYPALFEGDPAVDDQHAALAIDIAIVLEALGEDAKADRLIEGSLESLPTDSRDRKREFGLDKARGFALKGDRAAACRELSGAIDAGWRDHWWFYLSMDAAFDGIRDTPEFQAIVERQRSVIREQLIRVRAHEAAGAIALPPAFD